MINPKRRIFGFYVLPLLLTACVGNNEDLVRYIKEVNQRKTKEVESLPSFAPLPAFKFPEADDRRSPFKPIAQKPAVDVNAPDKNRPKQPLEAYPLDALKFVGTIKQGNEVWALIELPNQDITPVHIGNYMGQNYGRIESIKNDSIELIESTQSSGRWEKHITKIELYTGK